MTTDRRLSPPGSTPGGEGRLGEAEELRAVEFFDAPHLDLVEVAGHAGTTHPWGQVTVFTRSGSALRRPGLPPARRSVPTVSTRALLGQPGAGPQELTVDQLRKLVRS